MRNVAVVRLLSVVIATVLVAGIVGAVTFTEGPDLPESEQAATPTTRPSPPVTAEVNEVIDEAPAPETGLGTTTTAVGGTKPGGAGATTTTLKGAKTTTTTAPTTQPSAAPGPRATVDVSGIFAVGNDGKGLRLIVAGAFSFPTWSPNGARVAFGVPTSTPRLEVVNSDGTDRRRLASGSVLAPTWSPDSSRIAFMLGSGGAWDIYVVGADGSGQRALTARGDISGLSWAPHANTVAFIAGGDVFVINADGTGLRQVVDSDTAFRSIAWSPDGTRLAYYGAGRLWSVNFNGTELTNATTSDAFVLEWWDISWAPDSTRFAFQAGTGGASSVKVVGFDGSSLKTCAQDAMNPDWSPKHANRVAIFTAGESVGGGDRDSDLELADPDRASFRERIVTDEPGDFQSSGPQWSPNANELLFAVGGADRGGPNPPAA